MGTDCQSKVCAAGTCLAPTCDDQVKNGDETDVDCGGATCSTCGPDKGCLSGEDCKSGTCTSAHTCLSTCTDGLKGGAETDVDCGGGAASGCPGCANGGICKVGEDCESRICQAEVCVSSFVWNDGFEGAVPVALAVDSNARITMTGAIKGACDFGGGNVMSSGGFLGDPFVARYDTTGKYLWAKGFPASAAGVSGMAINSTDQTVIVGGFTGSLEIGTATTANGPWDAFVAKIDVSGTPVWLTHFGSSSAQVNANGVAVDANGGTVIAGSSTGSVDFGGGLLTSAGGKDVALIVLGPSGGHSWSRLFGGAQDQEAVGVAVDQSLNIYLAGTMSGSVSFGGNTLVAAGNRDIFVTKLDHLGTHLWSKSFGTVGATQSGTIRIAVDAAGSVFLAGRLDGPITFGGSALTPLTGQNAFVAKLDKDGGHVWSKALNDATSVNINGVSVNEAGAVLLIGDLTTKVDFGGGPVSSTGGSDAFAAVLDGSGNHVWSAGFGDATGGNDMVLAGTFAGDKNVVLAGSFAGTISFGGDPLTSVGSSAMFLTQLSTP